MRIVHLIWIVEDGISALTCGVGAVTRQFLACFPALRRVFATEGLDLRLSVLSLLHPPDGVGYDAHYPSVAQAVCRESGGDLALIPAIQSESYFDAAVWQSYADAARSIILSLPQFDEVLLVAHDAILGGIFLDLDEAPGAHAVWMPHGLSRIHQQSYLDTDGLASWEQSIVDSVCKRDRGWVAALNSGCAKVLSREYGVHSDDIFQWRNGFLLSSMEEQRIALARAPRPYVLEHLPSTAKVILAFGRLDEYKGLDSALEAMHLAAEKDTLVHGICIGSRFSAEEHSRQLERRLGVLAAQSAGRVSLVTGYEFAMPKLVLADPRTQILLHLPSRDCAPLIPAEAALLGNDELCLVSSRIPCNEETVEHGVDGLLVGGNVEEVADCALFLLRSKAGERRRMHSHWKARTLLERDYLANSLHALRHVLGNNSKHA